MIVSNITKTEERVLRKAGLSIFKNSVIGPVDKVLATHPILKAYIDYSKYITRGFILYVRDDSELMKRLKENDSDLLYGNLMVVILKTYEVYKHALDMVNDIGDLDRLLIHHWEKIEVYYSVRESTLPHVEPRFIYTPKTRGYQVKYKSKYYRVTIVKYECDDDTVEYGALVAELPQVYFDRVPTIEDIENHLRKYIRR